MQMPCSFLLMSQCTWAMRTPFSGEATSGLCMPSARWPHSQIILVPWDPDKEVDWQPVEGGQCGGVVLICSHPRPKSGCHVQDQLELRHRPHRQPNHIGLQVFTISELLGKACSNTPRLGGWDASHWAIFHACMTAKRLALTNS